MNRSTTWSVALATLSLCTAAHAAEPGFYFAATASRVEHEVDGLPGIAVFSAFVPPVFGGIIGNLPPTGGIIIIDPPNVITPTGVEIDDVDTGFSATVGYRINRYLAGELSYTDFGEYQRIERYSIGSDVRYELSVRGPSVSVIGSLPLGEQWEVFLRGGMLFADQKVSFRFGPGFDRTLSDEVVMAGAGVQWSFAPRWAARLEYQRTDDLKYDETGESSIKETSLSVLFKL